MIILLIILWFTLGILGAYIDSKVNNETWYLEDVIKAGLWGLIFLLFVLDSMLFTLSIWDTPIFKRRE